MRHTRILFVLILAALAMPLTVLAAPSNLEPLPEPPPPPAGLEGSDTEPQVTIIKKGSETIEEYRIGGELYMQKITPAHGKSYYLMREDENAGWTRLEDSQSPISIPKWVLFRF